MKRLISFILTVSLIAGFLSVVNATGVSDKQESAAIKNITIQLKDDGKSTVKAGNESFEMAFRTDCEGVLMGNGNNGVLLLLNLASEITGDQYDIYTRARTSTTGKKVWGHYETEFYDVIITAYKVPQPGHYAFNSSQVQIYKTLEYYNGGSMRNDGYAFDTLRTMPTPHLFVENGKYIYYLPLRYTFEQLGFKVDWEGSTKTITISR